MLDQLILIQKQEVGTDDPVMDADAIRGIMLDEINSVIVITVRFIVVTFCSNPGIIFSSTRLVFSDKSVETMRPLSKVILPPLEFELETSNVVWFVSKVCLSASVC